jgi:hypothetical protein
VETPEGKFFAWGTQENDFLEVAMQPILTEFEDRVFRYTQVERHGGLAIYCQEHKQGHVRRYEVIRIRIVPEHEWPDGRVTPEHEAYPGATRWGQDGWTTHTLAQAQMLLAEIAARRAPAERHAQDALQELEDETLAWQEARAQEEER